MPQHPPKVRLLHYFVGCSRLPSMLHPLWGKGYTNTLLHLLMTLTWLPSRGMADLHALPLNAACYIRSTSRCMETPKKEGFEQL